MRRISFILIAIWIVTATAAFGQKKDCEELKKEIAAKLDEKGVKNYTLDIVPAESVKDETVVGSCDAGTKRIVYKKGQ
ncbi:MAG TPA: DUF1161 domain-containing protein [Pyrinomonadaceae bacterium]|nr:DUF1161 domain-containing protein [Pyrinomonadaceae bacterium]